MLTIILHTLWHYSMASVVFILTETNSVLVKTLEL